MPLASAAVKAGSLAAPVAKKAAGSDWTPVILGLGALLVLRAVGQLGDVLRLPGDLAKGTGDFLTGAFTGADRPETPIETARTAEQPNILFQLTPPQDLAPTRVLGTPATFDPDAVTSVVVDMVDGEPVLTVTNANPAVPLPAFTIFGPDPSLAQKVGATLIFDPITGLYTDPLLDIRGVTIIPSVQDTISGIGGFFKRIF